MRDDPLIIAQKREARLRKKQELAQRQAEQKETGSSINETGFNTSFIKRSFRSIPAPVRDHNGHRKRASLSLLTYNILAQSLVRRKLFPTSGEALKWKNRQTVLMAELKHYTCDVMCLQEVGRDMLEPCLREFMEGEGYAYAFHAGKGKQHGLVIAYRKAHFEMASRHSIDYDECTAEIGEDDPPIPRSKNVGLVCVLRHNETGLAFVVATTHLFWHPRGTFERARQMGLLINFTLRISEENGIHGNVIIAGDFNTEPIQLDPTYLAITQRPFTVDAAGREILRNSVGAFGDEEQCEEDVELDPVSKTASATLSKDVDTIWSDRLVNLSQGPHMQSVYGKHYSAIETKNLGHYGEPACTNFAHVFRGTLDYILIPADSGISTSALLEVPDIRKLQASQPHEGEFPSDHFALASVLELCI